VDLARVDLAAPPSAGGGEPVNAELDETPEELRLEDLAAQFEARPDEDQPTARKPAPETAPTEATDDSPLEAPEELKTADTVLEDAEDGDDSLAALLAEAGIGSDEAEEPTEGGEAERLVLTETDRAETSGARSAKDDQGPIAPRIRATILSRAEYIARFGVRSDEAEEPTEGDEIERIILAETNRAKTSGARSAEDDQGPIAPRVRVTKMSRAEYKARFVEEETEAGMGLADDDEEQKAVPGDTNGIRQTIGETGLSQEDEDDLIKELAALELDVAAETEADVADELLPGDTGQDPNEAGDGDEDLTAAAEVSDSPADDEAAQGDHPAPRRRDTSSVTSEDVSVDRLLARADTALEEDEGSRRRSAIAHLKAAVASVRADGNRSGRESAQAETAREMDRYRADLAQVVRPDAAPQPSRTQPAPPTSEGGTERPTRNRPRRKMPPLMLVSEQRVDRDTDEAPAEAVQPRRVHAGDLDKEMERNELFGEDSLKGTVEGTGNMFSDAEDFKSYVADTGAEGVAELLEASLAFGLHVEGADVCSRQQIMSRVLGLFPDGSISREDGLRAFGVLLRQGRVTRIKRGEFLLPETSRFHPGTRREANSA
ncbi:MAG: hypothetical protein GY717_02510, partial [Rhodobacteraceae bacterium]|nr:hypothetical protein [Paracoccaceae bacterium]